MNVFIVGSPYETAAALDKSRLNKQIVECKQMLAAMNSETKAWRNHPCTLQYLDHSIWLREYMACLDAYRRGDYDKAQFHNCWSSLSTPPFHTQEYFDQMKRRLYTKNSEHYAQWADLGTSEVNWYFVDGEWRYYKNGKRVNEKQD